MDSNLSLAETRLARLEDEYYNLEKKALYGNSYDIDLQAAFLVPAVFLRNPSNFEATFDLIIYHLDEAYKKCSDEMTKRMISRAAEELFNNHVNVIQFRIEIAAKENQKEFLQKLKEFIKNIPKKLKTNIMETAIQATPDIIELGAEYFNYLANNWKIKEQEQYFYNQLVNVYQKILDSECFNPDIGLIRNNYLRNKENVLRCVIYEKGLFAALNLVKLDKNDSQLQDSMRIISFALVEKRDWENLIKLLSIAKEKNLPNYSELQKEAVEGYRKFKHGTKDNMGIIDSVISNCSDLVNSTLGFVGKSIISAIASIVAFLGTIYYKFSSNKILTNGFWDSVLRFFSLSFSTFLWAIGISFAFFILTYVLLSLSETMKNLLTTFKADKEVREFQNRILQIGENAKD